MTVCMLRREIKGTRKALSIELENKWNTNREDVS